MQTVAIADAIHAHFERLCPCARPSLRRAVGGPRTSRGHTTRAWASARAKEAMRKGPFADVVTLASLHEVRPPCLRRLPMPRLLARVTNLRL